MPFDIKDLRILHCTFRFRPRRLFMSAMMTMHLHVRYSTACDNSGIIQGGSFRGGKWIWFVSLSSQSAYFIFNEN